MSSKRNACSKLYEQFPLKSIKSIFTPRPGAYSSDEEDESPEWHRHFESDELFSVYQPIQELGTLSLSLYLSKFTSVLLQYSLNKKTEEHMLWFIKVKY